MDTGRALLWVCSR